MGKIDFASKRVHYESSRNASSKRRALNLTYRPEPVRVSVVLASNHVERKESRCKFLQFYKENDLSI